MVASENEINKSLKWLDYKWAVQNDKQDYDTGFIYYCSTLSQVFSLSVSNEVDIGYAVHRWFNFQCSKTVENIFCEFGATHCENEKDHDVDIYIQGIPFDVKVSVISSKYEGDTDLSKRANKDRYMKWLEDNASQEQRKHTANKIYVICESQQGKCNFDLIRKKVGSFVSYLFGKIDSMPFGSQVKMSDLIYIKEC